MEKERLGDIKILKPGKHEKQIRELKSKSFSVVDNVENQMLELIKIDNPSLLGKLSKKDIPKLLSKEVKNESGNWIYFPWRKSMVKILPEDIFYKLLTSKNRNLINNQEQKMFRGCRVGIAGLSVGSNIALMIKRQGGSDFMKIADFDDLELTNTNRMIANVTQLKLKKSEIVRRQILEINPYSKMEVYKEGITENNIENFFDRVDIVFDEVDNLGIKVKMREIAKKKKIPLIMITDNDDGILIDYYRFHKDSKLPLFHGLKDSLFKNVENISKMEMVQLSMKIIGGENISERMLMSLKEVGKTLNTWPQLGTAANFAGVVGSYLVRKYLLEKDLDFDRKLLRINKLL